MSARLANSTKRCINPPENPCRLIVWLLHAELREGRTVRYVSFSLHQRKHNDVKIKLATLIALVSIFSTAAFSQTATLTAAPKAPQPGAIVHLTLGVPATADPVVS